MGFWNGIKKIVDGFSEVAKTPWELADKWKDYRLSKLNGDYVVEISAKWGIEQPLIAYITYRGGVNMHDINRLVVKGESIDVWDKLSESQRNYVQYEINSFLLDLFNKRGISPYR